MTLPTPLPVWLQSALISGARSQRPYEACGLIGGGEPGLRLYWAENASESPRDSFLIAPQEQLRLLERIDRDGRELVAIVHSHPRSGPEPSRRDREMAKLWPDVLWVIIGLGAEQPEFYVGHP